jgi:hypothetical protein
VSPYSDSLNGINIIQNGNDIRFTASFGLTVIFNGQHSVSNTLCDAYSNHVCGLCGKMNGNVNNI